MSDHLLVLLGAGGHAKVLLDLIRGNAMPILGVCDPALAASGQSGWRGLRVLGDDSALENMAPSEILLINGLGSLPGQPARRDLFQRWQRRGYSFGTLVHPYAWVSESATLGAGAQVMAGAVIQADAHLQENVIVNTGARVDHDCRIGAHAHVAPGAVLCGAVEVGAGVHIGSGATVAQGLRIGADAVIGAGAVVVRDVPPGATLLGPKPALQRG